MPLSHLSVVNIAPDLADQVHAKLRDALTTGEIAPGERLTQEDLAEKLAVSRQPVLQALRVLKKEGFVVDAPGRGLMAAPLDARTLEQLYSVRGALDALAARLAAVQVAAGGATLDAGLIARGRKAAQGGRMSAMIDADTAFHHAIYAASGNPLIAESAERHWHHIRRAMGAVLRDSPSRTAVWDEHAAILQAIALGDATLAERLARDHGEVAGRNLAEQLGKALRAA